MDKIEIDPDTADRIVLCSLKETMSSLRGDILLLKSKKNLSKLQKQELGELVPFLYHLEQTFDYYGGNLK